jgi:hypothetical protein
MSPHRRLSAGAAALIFFAIFFALPLYAATTMCSMPCCHHGATGKVLKNDLPGCFGNECIITTDDVTVKAASSYVAPALTGIAHVATAIVAVTADAQTFAAASPPRGTPPLNLLNSVFRI